MMRHWFWSVLDNVFTWVYWRSLSRGYNRTLDSLQAFTYRKRWAAYKDTRKDWGKYDPRSH